MNVLKKNVLKKNTSKEKLNTKYVLHPSTASYEPWSLFEELPQFL